MHSATFVDYGCGMGRALLLAAESGFSNVVGVDHSALLIEICKKNISLYQERHPDSLIEAITCDATDFEIPDNAQIFFFFNPFKEGVMDLVSKRIRAHLIRIKKQGHVLYVNPIYEHLFTKLNFTRVTTVKSKSGYKEATIFSFENASV